MRQEKCRQEGNKKQEKRVEFSEELCSKEIRNEKKNRQERRER